MNIFLTEGNCSSNDTLNMISEMIQRNIRFHENKIGCSNNEEDIKFRESKIKQLQREWSQFQIQFNTKTNAVVDLKINLS